MINSYLLAGLTRGLSLRLADANPETRRSSYAREMEAEAGKEQAPASGRKLESTLRFSPWFPSNWRWAAR